MLGKTNGHVASCEYKIPDKEGGSTSNDWTGNCTEYCVENENEVVRTYRKNNKDR